MIAVYVEATLNMKMDTWLRCHVHMYEAFGGVPTRTICDNLKTVVVKHPKEGEIALTDAYEMLGLHYMTAIMPAAVRKPKDYRRKNVIGNSRAEPAYTIVLAEVFADNISSSSLN